ncbi:ErfK/YbiS/YcfS/YnhG family protein (plasmid) [Nostoc linckia NIES-25]|nr:ErfK/YbiS/YcfS/YnhG family protein [Nostoc linckia NIES-25]
MVKNESVGRMVMLLCFGTAFLSLAVHWRITTAQRQFEKSASASMRQGSSLNNPQGSRPEEAYKKNFSQVSLGQVALGASMPPVENVQGSTVERKLTSKSSAVKSSSQSKKIKKNVAKATVRSSSRLKAQTKSKKIKKNLPKVTQPIAFTLKPSALKSETKSQTIKKNIANPTEPPTNTRLVAQAETQNPIVDSWPKALWPQASAQQIPSNKLVSGKTKVVVDLSDRRTYVYAGDEVIASYPIAIGKEGWETPTGSFQVMHMRHFPVWRHPITGKVFQSGTNSPLGDRWIGFWSDGRNEIGFHGTPDIDLLGTAVSHGCLRMRNSDVRLLYEQVSLGTTVLVRD